MSWLSEALGGKKGRVEEYTVADPIKEAVAAPLSNYLSSQTGKGLPKFEDAPSIDPNATNRYNEFLSLNANDYFDKYVDQPQTKSFRENLLPTITEGYAGNLRGSGRFRTEEDAISKFEQDLSGLRYTANKELPQQQLEMASKYYDMQFKQYEANYQNWWKSLPENNPVVQQALAFLSIDNPSGKQTKVLETAPKEGIGKDIVKQTIMTILFGA